MDGIGLLRREALLKRDTVILEARREYRTAMQEIRALQRRLRLDGSSRPKQRAYDRLIATGDDSCRGMTTIGAAEKILREGKPLTMVELAIEVQRRGCRSGDDSRAVMRALRSGFGYQRKRFRKDRNGRWSIYAFSAD